MLNKKNTSILPSVIFAVLSFVFIILIKTVDVRAVGPMGTKIGFAAVNTAFNDMTGQNLFLYKLTEFTGIIAIIFAGVYALCGFVQLVKTKNIFDVDEEIICRGVIYAVVIILYALFEKIIINYRPVIMPGESLPEASFPSSHTMLVCCVMGCTLLSVRRLVKNYHFVTAVQIAAIIITVVTVIGRLFCGVHWLTDIIGGLLISAALVTLYSYLIDNVHLGNKIR